MSSPRNNLLGSVVKRLEKKDCLYQCNDLAFLECAPGEKRKYRFAVEVEEESGEKTAHIVAIYKEPKPGGPARVSETSAGEPRPPPRTSERKKITTTTTTSAIPGSHTSAPADSCRSSKRSASGSSARASKRQRTCDNGATAVITSGAKTSTRVPLRHRDTNISTTRVFPTLMPKLKPSLSIAPARTTQEVPTYDSDSTEDEDEQHDSDNNEDEDEQYDGLKDPSKEKARKDWAKHRYRDVMEAATFVPIPLPIQPDTAEHHFNDPMRLRPCKANAQSAEMKGKMEKVVEMVKRKKQLDEQDIHGRLSMTSLCMDFAHFMWEILRDKGQTYNPNPKRPARGKKMKYGKWDINSKDLTAALDAILQIDPKRVHKADAKRFMKEIHKGQEIQLPGNYDIRREALEMWRYGKKMCLFDMYAGRAGLLFLIQGPPSAPKYSARHRFGRSPLCHLDFIEGHMKIFREDRHIFTAMADRRCGHWRSLMESHGFHIDITLNPPKVQLGNRFYRGAFDEGTKTYNVELFSPNETRNYIANRVVEGGPIGTSDWGEHLKHNPWCRKYPCCAVYEPNPPIQAFDTEIPVLGIALRATQLLNPGDYVASHAGICKPAAECSDDEDEEDEEDRMEISIPGEGKYYIYQDEKWCMTKYINDSDTPNIEWVREVVDGIAHMLLKVKDGCIISPGDELTAYYGKRYWRGKAKYTGQRFLVH